MYWFVFILWSFVGLVVLLSDKKITRWDYFLVWIILMLHLLNNAINK